jgi:uncharacterized protein (DUF2267 family)
MDHDAFVDAVVQAARIDRDAAERAVRATLITLAERISAGEARDLASQLPPQLAPWLNVDERSERFDVDEFLRRVAERSGADEEAALQRARSVLAVLGQAIAPSELDDVGSELPKDYDVLLPRGPHTEVMPARAFCARVAERAGLDAEDARRATGAVLETLAERIAGGEADDLIVRLDPALHAPLRRGRERSGGVARPMALERFVALIAEREGLPVPGVALAHARAVLTTLREAVGDDEFFDVTVQLPQDYVNALIPART